MTKFKNGDLVEFVHGQGVGQGVVRGYVTDKNYRPSPALPPPVRPPGLPSSPRPSLRMALPPSTALS